MISKGKSNFIKLVGVITMLVDHIGAYLFPLDILRVIGRVAFPLFAYQLGVGYTMTSSKKNYVKKLFLFGVISQIPYSLLRADYQLNILFTFVLGIILIWALEERKFIYFLLVAPLTFFVDYGIYGLIVVLIFYFFKNKNHQFLLFFTATAVHSFYYSPLQIFSLFAIPLIFKPFLDIKLPKYFFYIFYPFHLLLIYFIKTFLI